MLAASNRPEEPMAYHHLAVAAKDIEVSHRFYTEAMGFELVKVVTAKTPEGGWAKHLFYETGGGELFALWDLHDEAIGSGWGEGLAKGVGLPVWVNHVAFDARDAGGLDAHKRRWLEHGHDVLEIDHGWCVSIYTEDPGGTLVEWSYTTRDFTDEDRAEARRLLADPRPPLESAPATRLHRASVYRKEA
jgi:catechol 2,3-dioxygenase-like lactoylglutathione lyase family enzyme